MAMFPIMGHELVRSFPSEGTGNYGSTFVIASSYEQWTQILM